MDRWEGRVMWTEEEIQFVKDNYTKISAREIGEILGKNRNTVISYCQRNKISSERHWTEEDEFFLEESYGHMSNEQLAIRLERTYWAVIHHARCMGLGSAKEAQDAVNLSTACRLVGIPYSTFRRKWVNDGLASRRIGGYRMIKLEALFAYMQEHRDKWNVFDCDFDYFDGFEWWRKILYEERAKRNDTKGSNTTKKAHSKIA